MSSRVVVLFIALVGLTGCARAPVTTDVDLVRVAMAQLFTVREHARAITLWQDTTVSLTLDAVAESDAQPRLPLDSATVALPMPTELATRATMDAFFRAHASGWDAWFEAHPGNAGVVEVATPRVFGDSATVVVGRACGEQCRNAWRVVLNRVRGAWVVRRVDVLRVPRGT